MIIGILIGIAIGFLYYMPIERFIMFMETRTMDEYYDFICDSMEFVVENKFMLALLIILRLPLIIVMIIPFSVHYIKLMKTESE